MKNTITLARLANIEALVAAEAMHKTTDEAAAQWLDDQSLVINNQWNLADYCAHGFHKYAPIAAFPRYYIVSDGNVWSTISHKFLVPVISDGKATVTLVADDGHKVRRDINQLIDKIDWAKI